MNYDINDKPGPLPMALYGLQWWLVTMPSVIILGLVASIHLFPQDPAAQILYLQKLFCVTGITIVAQILLGHRLPVVGGPASVLLIGMIASASASIAAVHTAILFGGAVVAATAWFGMLEKMRAVFTARVLVAIMAIIPFTLVPTILHLVFQDPHSRLFDFLFSIALVFAAILLNKTLRGVWKSTTLLWILLFGSLIVFAVKGLPSLPGAAAGTGKAEMFAGFEFDPGVVVAFVVCSLVLLINEISSVQAIGQGLGADGLEGRGRRGVIVTGMGNVAAGVLGVLGPVDYLTSAGIISATRCASRWPFLPAAGLLIVSALIPGVMEVLLALPGVVMGAVLLYIMATQLAAGLQMLVREKGVTDFDSGLTLAIPLMISMFVSFLPAEVSARIPMLVRPVMTNGFVMGVVAVLIMEHGVDRLRFGAEK